MTRERFTISGWGDPEEMLLDEVGLRLREGKPCRELRVPPFVWQNFFVRYSDRLGTSVAHKGEGGEVALCVCFAGQEIKVFSDNALTKNFPEDSYWVVP